MAPAPLLCEGRDPQLPGSEHSGKADMIPGRVNRPVKL
jgi:hypothetical protein